jgi:hypothetical protein
MLVWFVLLLPVQVPSTDYVPTPVPNPVPNPVMVPNPVLVPNPVPVYIPQQVGDNMKFTLRCMLQQLPM